MTLSTRHGRAALAALLLAALLGVVACMGSPTREDVPPQGWWAGRGPVVPHDGFPADCSLCHLGGSWHAIREDFEFDHESETGLPLRGAHSEAECLRCHNDRGPVEVFAQRGCAGCHEDVHRGQLGRDCATCHGEDDWLPNEVVAMHLRTRFPLVGAHAATPCWRCHRGAETGVFTRVSIECANCHQDDLARATSPDHLAQGWVDRCDRCHIPTTWAGAGFNHGTWPLTGAHRVIDCTECHVNDVFQGTPRNCVDCHLDEYNATTDPDHQAGNFSLDCMLCHGTTTWFGANFNHAGIVNGCVQCHLDDYQGTTDPDHQATGIQLECEQCHVTSTWFGAAFNHTGIRNGCVECHLDDYQATTDPNHLAAGFPQQCEACHGTNSWFGAVFDHDFPINNGPHGSLACADCHLQSRTFSTFSCTHCHEHRQSEADKEHQGVRGYVWSSRACFSCHPDGSD